MINPALEQFIRSIPLFKFVEPADMMDVLRLMREVQLDQDEVLFRQGQAGDAMFALGPGVEVALAATNDPHASPVQIATLKAGDTLGEMALIDDAPRSATALVTRPGKGYRIEAADFEVLRRNYTPAAFKIMRKMAQDMCQRLRNVSTRVGEDVPQPDFGQPVSWADARRLDSKDMDAFAPFRNVPATIKLALANRLVEKRLDEGALLIRQGDPADATYMLVEGQVGALAHGARLTTMEAGSFFGLVAAIDGGARSASCVVEAEARVWRLADADFDWLFGAGNRVAFQIVDLVARQLAALLRKANASLIAHEMEKALTAPANAIANIDFELEIEL